MFRCVEKTIYLRKIRTIGTDEVTLFLYFRPLPLPCCMVVAFGSSCLTHPPQFSAY